MGQSVQIGVQDRRSGNLVAPARWHNQPRVHDPQDRARVQVFDDGFAKKFWPDFHAMRLASARTVAGCAAAAETAARPSVVVADEDGVVMLVARRATTQKSQFDHARIADRVYRLGWDRDRISRLNA